MNTTKLIVVTIAPAKSVKKDPTQGTLDAFTKTKAKPAARKPKGDDPKESAKTKKPASKPIEVDSDDSDDYIVSKKAGGGKKVGSASEEESKPKAKGKAKAKPAPADSDDSEASMPAKGVKKGVKKADSDFDE